jgi:hypothetical protein
MIAFITDQKEERSHSYTVDFGLIRVLISGLLEQQPTPLFFTNGHDKVVVTYLDELRAGRYSRAIGFSRSNRSATRLRQRSERWLVWSKVGSAVFGLIGVAAIIGVTSEKRVRQCLLGHCLVTSSLWTKMSNDRSACRELSALGEHFVASCKYITDAVICLRPLTAERR